MTELEHNRKYMTMSCVVKNSINSRIDSITERSGNIKKFKYEFEVDDDFEVGCCYDCPMYDFIEELCKIGWEYKECPLEEAAEN